MMIDKKLLQQAIKVLRDVNKKHYEDSSKKRPLLEDEKETTLYLQITLKKIPKRKSIQMIKINLPHPLVKESSEVCLIIGDLDKRNHKAEIEPDVLHYKELLKKHGIDNISEVITLRQLRTEYKPYEAKQKLLAAYDVFLADRKIAECLPKVLGRHFFRKRKFPIQITINTPNLKQQVEKGLSTKVFYLTGHGNSCNSEVAYFDMSDLEISENVTEMAKAVCDQLPGSWNNVMGMYLKTSLSSSVPVYMSFDDPNEVHLEKEKWDNSYEIDELSTYPNSLVKVYKDGTVRTVRVKRMAETEIDETAGVDGDSENKIKNEENFTNDISLTNMDVIDKSAKVGRKSKSKKIKGESILEAETDKNMCSMKEEEEMKEVEETNNVGEKSKKKKIKKSISRDAVNKIVTETGLKEEMKDVEEAQNVGEKSNKKKIKKSISRDEVTQIITDSDLKGETADVDRNSKNKKKKENVTNGINLANTDINESVKVGRRSKSRRNKGENILEAETEIIICGIKEKEGMPEAMQKPKRKRGKSMLSDANTSMSHSPVQPIKMKVKENLKRSHSEKANSKGKERKGNHL